MAQTLDLPSRAAAARGESFGLETFSRLLEVVADLPLGEDLAAVYLRISDELRSFVDWDTASVLHLDDAGRLSFRWSLGHRDVAVESWVFGPGQGLVGRVAADGRGETASAENGVRPDLLPGHGAELAVPLTGRDRVVGVLVLGRFARGASFGRGDLDLLELVARHLGRALESSCAHATTRRLARNLSLLQEAGRELTSILDRQSLLERIAEMLGRLIDYQLFCVLLWNDERQRLEETYVRRTDRGDREGAHIREPPPHLALGEGLCGSAAALRQPIRVGNVLHDARFVPCGDERIRSALAVPLIFKDRLLGVLDLESHAYDAFSSEHEQMLATLGSSIAVALANAELYEQLRDDERLLAKDLETARTIQRLLLPRSTPWIEGVQLGASSAPSRHLGGDLYDFFPYGEGRTAVAVGDVAGKGTAAALYASLVLGVLRGYMQQTRCSPACVLSYMHEELRQLDVERRFLAFAFGVYDSNHRTLTLSNAGLPYPLLLRGGEVREIESAGLPLGAMERPQRSEIEIRLEPGDVVLLASDGLEECLDVADRPFGTERLAAALAEAAGGTAQEIAAALLEATDRHLGERARASDDRTVLVLKVTD